MDNLRRHSEYKGNVIERYKRMKDEEVQIEQDIQECQSQLMESEKERINKENDEEAIDELIKDYAKDDRFKEYLVDGAILRCTKATINDFKVSDGIRIKLAKDVEGIIEDREHTSLHVYENPMSVNGLKYATVKNTAMYQNIVPFYCNCMLPVDKDEEKEKIMIDEKCSIYGVCRHLIELNDEWENLPIEGISYLKKKRAFGVGGAAVFFPESSMTVEEECITMTSVLFCRHGGIIYPETSGQQIEAQITVSALACATGGTHADRLSWEQMLNNAEYIYNYFTERGWTTEAICGLLGNIYEECKMNPGAWEIFDNEEHGYGLVQWTEAKDFFEDVGLTKTEADNLATADAKKLMDIQLNYLEDSLQPSEKRWLIQNAQKFYKKLPLSHGTSNTMTSEEFSQSTCNPGDLALVFHASYERSGDEKDALQERVDAANAWYKYFEEGCEITLEDFSS